MIDNRRPNVILIVMDAVRADHFPSLGYSRMTTPCLDEFSKGAITFKQAVATSPWTLPSHTSLFSGLYCSEHGVWTDEQKVDESVPLIASLLNRNGYSTAGFTNNPWASSISSLDRGFDTFVEVHREMRKGGKTRSAWRKIRSLFSMLDYGAEATNRHVKDWLRSVKGSGAPVFIFANLMEAHSPYTSKRPVHAKFSEHPIRAILTSRFSRRSNNHIGKMAIGSLEPTPEYFDSMIGLYDSAIYYLDHKIGELFDFLKENSLFDETMIIVTSDHGENFGEHRSPCGGVLTAHRFCLYDTLLRVPLIVKLPFGERGGEQVHQQVQLTDVVPMILDVANIDLPSPWETDSGILAMNGLARPHCDYGFAEYVSPPAHLRAIERENPQLVDEFDLELRSIRGERYKLILSNGLGPELYDLREDPGELANIATDQPDVVEGLRQELGNWRARETKRYAPDQAETIDDEIIKERLRALGYL